MPATINTAQLAAIAAALFGRVSYQGPATLYAALIVGATDGLTGGTEATGGSYARVAITNNQTNFPAANPTVNANVITWPTSSAAWGTVNAVRFFDASSGGTLIGGAPLTPAASVDAAGITVTVPAGSLALTVAS